MSFVTTPGQHEKTSPGNVNKYSPDQDRDEDGRFGSGSGGGDDTDDKDTDARAEEDSDEELGSNLSEAFPDNRIESYAEGGTLTNNRGFTIRDARGEELDEDVVINRLAREYRSTGVPVESFRSAGILSNDSGIVVSPGQADEMQIVAVRARGGVQVTWLGSYKERER